MATLGQSIARRSSQPEVLSAIKEDGVSLAVWERNGPRELDQLITEETRLVRFTCPLDELETRLEAELAANGFAPVPQAADLIEDIEGLAGHFCEIMGTRNVDLRLEVVTTNACRKFHGDYVKARLITSYLGEGTQWLEHSDAQRVAKGLEPYEIKQLSLGDVGMFEGKLATDEPIIHRSPPIEGTGQTRLLLVLNPA